jgi:site-specific DNA-methyltransferase (adenine-specific)
MSKRWFGRKHDTILVYVRSQDYKFIPQKEKSYLSHKYGFTNVEIKQDEKGYYTEVGMRDVWDIPALRGNQPETIGYPTQKPEAIIERLITGMTKGGDVVADFFVGGRTTPAVAQRLNRSWIACDQSRVAVAITADRLTTQVEEQTGKIFSVPDFSVEHWGVYEARRLAQMPPEQFLQFVLRAFGAVPDDEQKGIHGMKGALPV